MSNQDNEQTITPELIARINALSKKAKTVGLTDEEKAEQQHVREIYRAAFRKNFSSLLKNVEVVDEPPKQ